MIKFNSIISTPVSIIIIITATVIIFGGVFTYQYLAKQNQSQEGITNIKFNSLPAQTHNKNQGSITNPEPVNGNGVECQVNSDCQKGSSCITEGPIIANQPVHKFCVPSGQSVPL